MPQENHRSAWHWVRALPDDWSGGQKRAPASKQAQWLTLDLTTDRAGGDTYDFWRSTVYYDFSADKRLDPAKPFTARAQAVVSPRGEFVHARSSDLSGARTRASLAALENSNLTIGLVLAGRREYELGDWRHRAQAGDLYIYDASRPSRLAMSDHRVVYLSLKADEVDRVLGPNRPSPDALLQRLSQAPLRPYLEMQLALLVESERRPMTRDSGRLLDIAFDLALLMLQQAPILPDMDPGALRRGMVAAAQEVIAREIHDPQLDPDRIAARLGLSRATLYRAFAGQGLTIAGQIRTLRLIHARHLLERSAVRERIGDLILHCGIEDDIHFARQFRQLFGIRPSEIKGLRVDEEIL